MSFSIRNLFRSSRAEAAAPNDNRGLSQKFLARGIAAETTGSPTKALHHFRKAVDADDSFAEAHMNLGIALQAAGELSAAKASYERAIAIDPEYASAHYNLARTHLLHSQYSAAEAEFRASLRVRKEFPEAWVGLAGALEALGRNEDALFALESAIAVRPDYAGALLNSITLLHKMERVDAAATNSRRLLELEPENSLAHTSLGIHLHRHRQLFEAETSFRLALTFNPEYSQAKTGLAVVLLAMGRAQEAVPLLLDLLANDPPNPQTRRYLAQALDGIALNMTGARERSLLLSLCMDDTISIQFLNASIVTFLKGDAGFQILQKNARLPGNVLYSAVPEVAALLREPILLAALPRMPMVDADVEEVLTYIRRCILFRIKPTSALGDVTPAFPLEFIYALARHCFFAGYTFFAEEDELHQIASLRKALQDELRDTTVRPSATESSLAVFALYDSLHNLQGIQRMLDDGTADCSDAFLTLVREQITDRIRERAIALELTSITAIEDTVSLAVRAQYEESPYPRWVTVQFPNAETIESLSRRLRPDQEVRVRSRPVSILVAGCGTGHLSIQYAKFQPDGDILAIDLSLASLSYAARMTERFEISNITYRQADILKLGELDRRFAIVDCSGVLHHLEDPIAGWRVLVNLMESDGLMKISLYSETARRAIQAAREFARSLNLPPTPEGIRRCRHAIAGLPDGHPAKNVTTYGDFYVRDGFRDMIMHVQEHQFTLPRLEKCLDQLGLRFLEMECRPTAYSQFRKMFPDDDSVASLAAWHQFEEAHPDTFISMYAFWCCKIQP